MNLFTIELIQTAVSFLPFLIAFTLMFSKALGKYWILPTLAFASNSAYRIFMLYEAAGSPVNIAESRDLMIAFSPSIINFILFLGMLSIQVSLLREQESHTRDQQKLLAGPKIQDTTPKEEHTPPDAPEDKKKILIHPAPAEPAERIAVIRVPEDPAERREMIEKISLIRAELQNVLELAQFNGALKKPRKKKKVPKRRSRKK